MNTKFKTRLLSLICAAFMLADAALGMGICLEDVMAADEVASVELATDGSFTHIEAEDSEYDDTFTVASDSTASGGKALKVNTSATLPDTNNVSYLTEYGMSFKVKSNKDTVYLVWAKVRGTGDNNSFWQRVDTAGWTQTAHPGHEYTWMLFGYHRFKEGEHEIDIMHRAKGLYVDKIAVTTDPSINPDGDAVFPSLGSVPGTGESSELYYDLPEYLPAKGQHPRVEVSAADIPKIRENLEHPQNAATYTALVNSAKKDINNGLLEPLANGAVGSNISIPYGITIESNALLYLLEGDREQGKKTVEMAKNYISSAVAGTSANDRERGNMFLVYIAAKVYDWCYDLLTDSDKKFLESYMLYCIAKNTTGWPPVLDAGGPATGKLTETNYVRDAFAAAIALYDERPDVYNVIAGRILQEYVPTQNVMMNSLIHPTGSSYGYFRLLCAMECAHLFEKMGHKNVFNRDGLRNAAYEYFYIKRPDGKLLNLGDNADEAKWGDHYSWYRAAFFGANLFKDPYLKAEFLRLKENGYCGEGSDITDITPAKYLIVNDVTVPVASRRDLPLSTFSGFPMGYMIAKTSHEEGFGSNSVLCSMNIQQIHFGGHQHRDSGHFDLYYKGLLAVDSGAYKNYSLSYGTPHQFNYSKRAIAHNTMLIVDPDDVNAQDKYPDGPDYGQLNYSTGGVSKLGDMFGGQLYENGTRAGEVLSYDFGPDIKAPAYTYMKGDITDSYTDKVEEFQRSFMFLNFFDEEYPAALIVFDNIRSAEASFTKKWLLHTQEEPVIDEDANTFTAKRTEFGYGGRLINSTLLPKEVKYEKIGGEGKEFWVNDKNYDTDLKHPAQESGKWRIEMSPSESNKQDYFLNVLQVGDNDDSIVPLEATLLEDGEDFVGLAIKDRVVYFKKDGKPTKADVSVKDTAANVDRMYIITGLAAGKWEAKNANGVVVAEGFVAEGHDAFSFTAPQGNYTLKWSYEKNIPVKDYSIAGNTDGATKKDIDVKIGSFYETFEPGFIYENEVLYAPVEELLKRLEVSYTKAGNSFTAKGVTYNPSTEGAKVVDGVLYMNATTIVEDCDGSITYDAFGRIARITYSGRAVDKLFQ